MLALATSCLFILVEGVCSFHLIAAVSQSRCDNRSAGGCSLTSDRFPVALRAEWARCGNTEKERKSGEEEEEEEGEKSGEREVGLDQQVFFFFFLTKLQVQWKVNRTQTTTEVSNKTSGQINQSATFLLLRLLFDDLKHLYMVIYVSVSNLFTFLSSSLHLHCS